MLGLLRLRYGPIMLASHSAPALATAVRLTAQWLLVVPVFVTLWAVVLRRQWRADILEAAVAGVLAVVFVKIAGAAYFHTRPFVVYGRPALIPHAPDNAFPSDHLAACGLAIGYLWTRNRALMLVAAISAVLIGAARVLAGLHWEIDVIAGLLLGLFAVAVARVVIALTARRSRAH